MLTFAVAVLAVAGEPCKVKVVDEENGWPVPLVFLTTTHGQVYVTDNAGVAAIDSPEESCISSCSVTLPSCSSFCFK